MAAGAKKRGGKDGEREWEERADTHSFAPKAGEATGPFPEAVLLKNLSATFGAARLHALLLVPMPFLDCLCFGK